MKIDEPKRTCLYSGEKLNCMVRLSIVILSVFCIGVAYVVTVPSTPQKVAFGTCFAVNADGYLLTANHVIEGSRTIKIRFHDGREFPAQIESTNQSIDLAVLKVDPKGKPLNALSMVTSRSQQIGDKVFTIGFPRPDQLGTTPKYTEGKINSMTGIKKGDASLMQVSVPIQPGNSGGPLVNSDGDVIGIVLSTVKLRSLSNHPWGALPQNINLAVKSDLAVALGDFIELGSKDKSKSNPIRRVEKAVCHVSVTADLESWAEFALFLGVVALFIGWIALRHIHKNPRIRHWIEKKWKSIFRSVTPWEHRESQRRAKLAYLNSIASKFGFTALEDTRLPEKVTVLPFFEGYNPSQRPSVENLIYGSINHVDAWVFCFTESGGDDEDKIVPAVLFQTVGKTFPTFRLYPDPLESPLLRKARKVTGLHDSYNVDYSDHDSSFPSHYLLSAKDESDARAIFTDRVNSYFSDHPNWLVEGAKDMLLIYRRDVLVGINQYRELVDEALLILKVINPELGA